MFNLYGGVIFIQIIIWVVADVTKLPPRGLYTNEDHIRSHTIVFPRKVTHEGEFLSHNVTHHYEKNKNIFSDDSEVHYKLDVGEYEYHLQLKPSNNFISPGMVVENHKQNIRKRRSIKDHAAKCHYKGTIRYQPDSHVVLSTCDGLAGFLHGEHGELWLEPVAREHEHKYTTTREARPHVLFSKSHNPNLNKNKSEVSFQLASKYSGTELPNVKKPQHKRKKTHKRNCGTREPRRFSETFLKWRKKSGPVQVQGRRKKFNRRNHNRKSDSKRIKKSISRPRHVETLIVADTTMMAFHQDGDIETYLLTIMNMVSTLYLDPTIGNFINVVVVRIILLEEDEVEQGLNITVNADETLYNFCEWQKKLNPPDDSHPNHHDVAILITREDICSRSNAPCSTLGVAHVAGMCQPDRSCSVNEDNGITLAHTITHELGHNFGMYHDTDKIGCGKKDGEKLHVMTPTFESDTVGVAWSSCSRRDITHFLDQGKGGCLDDEPVDNDYAYPDLPPGALYSAEHQCKLQFAVKETSVCSPLEEICSKLWCIVDGVCTTMLHPAAPGTHCGKNMWCQNQECVPIVDKPTQINGGWGEWGEWSQCSRSCGAGISIVERKCDHPDPAHGGKFCIGRRRRYKICNTQPCPEGAPSFRSVQCSNYNSKEYKGKNYTWLPYFDQLEPCELYCTDTEESVIVPLGETALDGTPCNIGTRDMCISGMCRKVGCDWIVDSDATEDRCGICHGDGTRCITIRGLYNNSNGTGYKEIILIPKGSRNIQIEETSNSKNYISIGRPNSTEYFLNGKRQITLAGEYQIAGSAALYERYGDQEKIRIPGPIKEDIVIYLFDRGHFWNSGISYEYTVPKNNTDRVPEYFWKFSDWSLCSVTCGGGLKISHALCNEKSSGVVEDTFCNETKKPEFKTLECNIQPCPARWWVGPWKPCPITCGDNAIRNRTVMCVSVNNDDDQTELALPETECANHTKPKEIEPCPHLPICETSSEKSYVSYNISAYNSENGNVKDPPIYNNTGIEPDILEFDNIIDVDNPKNNSVYDASPKWLVSKWSHCIGGKKTRNVTCSVKDGSATCTSENKPVDEELCNSGKWITGKWSACNSTCNSKSGQKNREVTCVDKHSNQPSSDCNSERKPLDTKRCHQKKQCFQETEDCKDDIDPVWICSAYKSMCGTSSEVREKCCATCLKKRKHVRHNRRQETAD